MTTTKALEIRPAIVTNEQLEYLDALRLGAGSPANALRRFALGVQHDPRLLDAQFRGATPSRRLIPARCGTPNSRPKRNPAEAGLDRTRRRLHFRSRASPRTPWMRAARLHESRTALLR